MPSAVARTCRPETCTDPVEARARGSAREGAVSSYHLPLLAAGAWPIGSDWAWRVITRERDAASRRAQSLLAAAGIFPNDGYIYHGILHPDHPDYELVSSVCRSAPESNTVERWAGDGWDYPAEPPEGVEYVLLDAEVLADVLDAVNSGSAGLVLRPVQPRGWLPSDQQPAGPIYAAGTPNHTGAMVALFPDSDAAHHLVVPGGEGIDDLHVTLAYLGDTEEDEIDYDAVHRAVAKWARRFGPFDVRVNGIGQFYNEDAVTYASVDSGELPPAREALVEALRSEGVEARTDHGFSPHITLAQEARDDIDLEPLDTSFDRVTVAYADDRVDYDLGQPVVAAGTSPDIVYAIVDEFDTTAVLDLIRISPGPTAYVRKGGKWLKDEKMAIRLMGVDPPPVVEVQPELVRQVIDQVDAYDRENPEAVTAAFGMGKWTENLHPRKGGKFASKPGGPAMKAARPGRNRPRKGLTPYERRHKPGGGPSPREKPVPNMDRGQIRDKPWELVRGRSGLDDLDLGGQFWGAQPSGFKDWLQGWMQDKLKEEHGSADDSGSESPDTRDPLAKKVGKKAAKKGRAKGDRIAERERKRETESSAPTWMNEVPPRFRGAMRQFMSAAAISIRSGPRKRSAMVDYGDYDNKFDLDFAKEGMGESRKRDVFDRQIKGKRSRLLKAGLARESVDSVMRAQVVAEKQRREAFDNQRRMRAEQERVRRMKVREAERKRTRDDGRTAPGIQAASPPAHSTMPGNLQKYWAGGEGAAKIRWGTSGDFDRCRRALAKYLRPDQISGACANLHKLATGSWPGKQTKH